MQCGYKPKKEQYEMNERGLLNYLTPPVVVMALVVGTVIIRAVYVSM